jgi:hypothetical protein
MKTPFLPVLALSILAVSLPVSAQQPRVVTPPPPQVPRQSAFPQPGQPSPRPAADELPHNVKLTLEGSLFGAIPTDFSITTGGTTVSTDLPLEESGPKPIMGTFEASLSPGEPWKVQVSLGARVPIPVGANNIEYRDFVLNTTVRIAPGKKVVLWQKGEQKLTLSMEKVEE